MKREEIASFRYIHWIIQLMWGRRYYYDFLQLFLGLGVHPADFAVEIYHAMKKTMVRLVKFTINLQMIIRWNF